MPVRLPSSLFPLAFLPSLAPSLRFRGRFDRDSQADITVMLTLLLGKDAKSFRISHQEMIKGVRLGGVGKTLAYFNTLEVPIIENTAREEDLTDSMGKAMEEYPDAAAILVRRHGVYVWGELTTQAALSMRQAALPRSVAERATQIGHRKLTERSLVGVREDPGGVSRLPVRDRRQDAPSRHPPRGRRLESSSSRRAPLEHITICISHSATIRFLLLLRSAACMEQILPKVSKTALAQ